MAAEAECIIQVRAPAKINLALHVTGQRADGYHLLDSLVCFADVCDLVSAREAATTSLTLQGEMAKGLTAGPENLVLRAAALMGRPAALTLEKVLPLASGIGGGSSDAAATLRALSALHGLPLPGTEALLALGADLPVCLMGRPAIMQGIGETLTPVTLPKAHLVLVNPGLECPTPQVFRALSRRDNPALPDLPPLSDAASLAAWLHQTRNDLQAPALALRPEIAAPLAALDATADCLIARMSGSGATCFGLYATRAQAESAAQSLARPGWWVRAAALL